MKKKLLALLMIGTLCFSLAACGDTGVNTAREDAEEGETLDEEELDAELDGGLELEEGDEIEIPDAIVNISPEDDKALTGVLTEDSYTNEYFGFVFNKPEGGTLENLINEGTELSSLSKAYEDGFGCILISSTCADETCSFSITVSALTSKEQGKTEEELVQERFDMEQGINEGLEYEAECSVDKITIAGEEHPAYIEIADNEEGTPYKSASTYIVKGDFECSIYLYAPVDEFDENLKQFVKIQ
ncbi:MAG: hypothetical protein Q4F43_00670 [Eubacteriales bacterium]|nr:hypothetical protein [Eubacteriales bacterium]